MPDKTVIADLLGCEKHGFCGTEWPGDLAVFHGRREWCQSLCSLPFFCDPEEWLDRAPELVSFRDFELLARSDARRRYRDGESIYIIGLERTVAPLRELCNRLADDLWLNP